MSQASKHVKWCLNKAKKEIEECEKVGKRKKHRGLLEKEPNIEIAKKHIEKAIHNLNLIELLEKQGFSDWSINAAFYAIYHCFLAIASRFGYESRNQTCTISLIEYLKEEEKINIDDKYIDMLKYAEVEAEKENSIIEMREEFTYGIKFSPENKKKINELVEDCKNLIDLVKEIVYG